MARAIKIIDGKPVITEKHLQELVRKSALLLGYKYFHVWNSMHSPKGFPDICMVRPKDGRLIFLELKSAKGKVTPEQQEWIDALGKVAESVEVRVVRPADFDELFAWLK